jgi:hypothetical protein
MSNNWWANKLGTPQQQPQAQPPMAPIPSQYVPQQPSYPQQPQQYAPSQYPASQNIQLAPRCPGCGSGNYVGGEGSRARCYDCGYPIQQSGSGMGKGIMGGPSASGPTQAARQVPSGGFNPQTIIGHI